MRMFGTSATYDFSLSRSDGGAGSHRHVKSGASRMFGASGSISLMFAYDAGSRA